MNIESILADAPALLPRFEQLIGDAAGNRTHRGVHVHEIFFLYAACAPLFDDAAARRPRQVLESGRAQGQSTLLLARCLPGDTPILSVEYNADHPDAPRALARLRPYPNVACLFGDATILLPQRILPGDIAVIDGPKGVRGIRLALALLRREAACVFLHDCPRDSSTRPLIEKHIPHAFFSDDPTFVERYAHLNTYMTPGKLAHWSRATQNDPREPYGGTFACIPARHAFPSRLDSLKLNAAFWLYKRRRSLRKRGLNLRLEHKSPHQNEPRL